MLKLRSNGIALDILEVLLEVYDARSDPMKCRVLGRYVKLRRGWSLVTHERYARVAYWCAKLHDAGLVRVDKVTKHKVDVFGKEQFSIYGDVHITQAGVDLCRSMVVMREVSS